MMAPSYHPYPTTPVVHQPYFVNAPHASTSYHISSPAAPMIPSAPSFASGPSSGFSPVYSPSPAQSAYFAHPHHGYQGYHPSPSYPAVHEHVKSNPATGLPTEMRALPHAAEYTSFAPTTSPGSGRRAELPIGRRQRVTMACTYCRRRKIRCDGGSPCTNCTRGHRCCDYTPISATESTKASRARKMAQALRESMPEDMSRPGTCSTSSGSADRKRSEGDFAFGLESAPPPGVGPFHQVSHGTMHTSAVKPSRHIGNFQPLTQETPSVLMPSVTIAPPSKKISATDMGHNVVPLVYQPNRSDSSGSSTSSEYPRSVRPQLHHSRTGFTSIGPVSPPYTPSTNDKYPSSGPSMVDISATPDLITPMSGFNFDNGPMMSYPRAYPSRDETERYQTMAPASHSQGFLQPTTFVHGNGYHGMTSFSAPVSPSHGGNLRRTISQGPHVYGTAMPPSTYASQISNGGLVGLGIMMPTGEPDLFDGLKPQGQPGSAIHSGM